MAKPTNSTLVNLYGAELAPDAAHDLYVITTQLMVPKGTDFEAFLASMMTGNASQTAIEMVKSSITDVTKVG